MRGSEDIPSWELITYRAGEKITLGGTSSETIGIDFSDKQWQDVASLNVPVCLPVPSNITPEKLREIIKRAIGFKVKITDARYFNEYANKPDLNGVLMSEIPAHTDSLVTAYVEKVAPLRAVVESMLTVTHIYAGIYDEPERYTNPESSRILTYKMQWMKKLDEVLHPNDGIDVHVYDRGGESPQINEVSLRAFFAQFKRPMYVIESGCLPQGTFPDQYRTFRTWDMLHAILGEKDEFGVQLMEQVNFAFGLVNKGKLTNFGEKYLSLPRKTRPRILKVKLAFGFGLFKWWNVQYSDGTENIVFGKNKPIEGTLV